MQFKEGSGGGDGLSAENFIKLKDKEFVRGVFRGEPFEFKKHWVGNSTVPCTGPGCEHCELGEKPSFRFRLNLIVKDASGAYVPKIFENGWTVYLQLKELNVDYPLEKHLVKITRSGSGKNDTSYAILPVPAGNVTPQLEALLAKVPLLPLSPDSHQEQPPHPVAQHQPAMEHSAPMQTTFSEDDIPF